MHWLGCWETTQSGKEQGRLPILEIHKGFSNHKGGGRGGGEGLEETGETGSAGLGDTWEEEEKKNFTKRGMEATGVGIQVMAAAAAGDTRGGARLGGAEGF